MTRLVPFVMTHVMNPLIELFTPPCKAFSAPVYALYEDCYIPALSLYTGKSVSKIDMTKPEARQNCEKFLQSILRIGVTYAVFCAYDKAWSYGSYYFGVGGSLIGFVVCLSALHAVDSKSNDMGRSAWFLFRGTISLLKTFGDSRAALLCLVLVREKEYKGEQGLLSYGPVKNTIKSIANWAYPDPAAPQIPNPRNSPAQRQNPIPPRGFTSEVGKEEAKKHGDEKLQEDLLQNLKKNQLVDCHENVLKGQ
jgi:hypothetical protein